MGLFIIFYVIFLASLETDFLQVLEFVLGEKHFLFTFEILSHGLLMLLSLFHLVEKIFHLFTELVDLAANFCDG